MVVHIVMCKFKSELSESDKRIALFKIKKGIENLNDKINGLVKISVETLLLPTSDMDYLIKAKFDNEESLTAYRESPMYLPIRSYMEKVVGEFHRIDYHE